MPLSMKNGCAEGGGLAIGFEEKPVRAVHDFNLIGVLPEATKRGFPTLLTLYAPRSTICDRKNGKIPRRFSFGHKKSPRS